MIGVYRMGFDIDAADRGCRVRMWIDYDLPRSAPARWLGRLFGRAYARWRTGQMLRGCRRAFGA